MNSIKHIVLALVLATTGLGVASAAGKATAKKPAAANCCKMKKGGAMMACCKTKSKSSKGKATVMACCKEHMGMMGDMGKKPAAKPGEKKPAAKPTDAAKPAAKPDMKM